MTPKRRILLTGSAALLALSLAGCSQMSTDSIGVPSTSIGSSGADIAVDPGMGDASVKNSAGGSSALSNAGIGGTSTVTTTWLSLTATDPVSTADQAGAIAEAAGGYVETRSESSGGGVVVPLSGVKGDVTVGGQGPTDYVSLTLRVPTAKANAVIGDLKKLGRVSSYNQSQYDVGQQQADLDDDAAPARVADDGQRALQRRGEGEPHAVGRVRHHRIGGAYCKPPSFHSLLRPRSIAMRDPAPRLRSKLSP